MEYKKFREALMGYTVVNRDSGKPITKIEFFFKASEKDMAQIIVDSHPKYTLANSDGWRNGLYYG